ncbi:MAG TPA: M20/M25/M40 family metallo-hydrolase, partial [Oligoflexia bacterium]|nr:M20/M25/M40 family metallo-hydrolase [Oligoflexia bacterium]
MNKRSSTIRKELALANLMDLLKIGGLSGHEAAVAGYVARSLRKAGAKKHWITCDNAHKKIGCGFEAGNLIVKFPGTHRAARLLFSAHLDTVPLCRGAVPIRRGHRIVAKGETALGGDNRAGVACLLTAAQALMQDDLPHPPLTFLFTVGEELGLAGARHVSARALGYPAMGFNFDGGNSGDIIVGAVGADRWEIEVFGLSAHAGVCPERGVSAALIAGEALSLMKKRSLWGKIKHQHGRGTSNIGIIRGGEATNQVLDRLYLKGESRSHDLKFLSTLTSRIEQCFVEAAHSVTNDQGKHGYIQFTLHRNYEPYRLDPTAPVVEPVRFIVSVQRKLNVSM